MGNTLRWLLVAILGLAVPASAQWETSHWYFGHFAGLHFSGPSPAVINDGRTQTVEGTAVISDGWGNLLFYTDGRSIWDRNHNSMPNGTDLDGGASSAQAALIVREPGSRTRYFVFTTFHMGLSPGLNYSVVDMEANGGLGDVVLKNVPLQDPVSEKITAYKHSNNRDIWIVSHAFGSNEFQARLLTESGLGAPVSSFVGSVHGSIPENAIGFMRFSPDGQWLAAALFKQNKVDLFRFDRNTGQVYAPLELPQDDWAYGVEFSPNSTKLYVTTQVSISRVVQYDLSSGDYALIPATRTVVGVPSVSQPGGLALGMDGRIYMSAWNNFLSVIEQPDLAGAACTYVNNAINLGSGLAKLSIPNFPSYLFVPNSIVATGICAGDTTWLSLSDMSDVDSITWFVGDPLLGLDHAFSDLETWHRYAVPGTYTVTAIVHGWGPPDTLSHTLTIEARPSISLGGDTSLCAGMHSVTLSASFSGLSYVTWHDGSTEAVYHATSPGTVWASGTNACASAADTIAVHASSLLVNLGEDRSICRQEGVMLDTGYPDFIHLWNTGATSSSVFAVNPGLYQVEVTDPTTGCIGADSVWVNLSEVVVTLPVEITLSSGESAVLDAGNPGASYLWSTGETTRSITVSEPGTYTVTVTNADGCMAAASTVVSKASGLGVSESLQASLSLAPVPTSGVLNLYWQGAQTLDGYGRIVGADGRTVWMGRVLLAPGAVRTFDLAHLPAGSYALRVETAQGQWLGKRFVKTD